MKTANLFPGFVLMFAIFLLGSCAAFDESQTPAGSGETTHAMWGNRHDGNDCSHRQNHPVGVSNNYPFSMHSEPFTYCPKCGRYERVRQ